MTPDDTVMRCWSLRYMSQCPYLVESTLSPIVSLVPLRTTEAPHQTREEMDLPLVLLSRPLTWCASLHRENGPSPRRFLPASMPLSLALSCKGMS